MWRSVLKAFIRSLVDVGHVRRAVRFVHLSSVQYGKMGEQVISSGLSIYWYGFS